MQAAPKAQMPSSSSSETQYLSVGDIVCLFYVKLGANLCSEGILNDEVLVSEVNRKQIGDCLFQVHSKKEYSAAAELEHFLESHENIDHDSNDNGKEVEDPARKRFHQALDKGQENESIMNAHFLQQKMGSPVVFGDIIQLFHIKSGKYLTVDHPNLSIVEKEFMRLSLNPDGSNFSWLQINPRFKIDREGDRVATNTEVYFRFSDRGNEYLHCADKGSMPREANAALDTQTPWRINIYQRYADTLFEDHILANQLVYFADPEIKAYLTVIERPVTINAVAMDHNSANGKGRNEKRVEMTVKGGEEEYNQIPSSQGDGNESIADGTIVSCASLDSLDDFTERYGRVILRKQDNVSSDLLWVLEKENVFKGGNFKCKADSMRLRHFNTGYCISIATHIGEKNTEIIESVENYKLQLIDDSDSDPWNNRSFHVTEFNPKYSYIQNGHPVNISPQERLYVERGEYFHDIGYIVKITKVRAKAVSLIINRYEEEGSDSNDHMITQPMDTNVGRAAKTLLQKTLQMIRLPAFMKDITAESSLWTEPNSQVAENFISTMSLLISYINGFAISHGVTPITTPVGPEHVRGRQNLMKEQGVVENAIRILSSLSSIHSYSDEGREDCIKILNEGSDIVANCLRFLIAVCKDNPDNQMYVADFLVILIEHASVEPLAGVLIQLMLNQNVQLQNEKISTDEISYFREKLLEHDMRSIFLNLMEACCVCNGEGVSVNQLKVADVLFSMRNEVFINVNVDYDNIIDTNLNVSSLYSYSHDDERVLGKSIFIDGCPNVLLSWKSKDEKYSPEYLFQRLEVPVKEIFRGNSSIFTPYSQQISLSELSSSRISFMRTSVAQYFTSQLNLLSSMCLGRNYFIMKTISEEYSVEVLLSLFIIVDDETLKGAVIRLIQSLYIDRDSQAEVVTPRYTRVWLGGDEDVDAMKKFNILQQITSDYIKSYSERAFDVCILNICKLLQCFIRFNFYCSVEKLEDLSLKLFEAVDRRDIEYEAQSVLRNDSKQMNGKKKSSNLSRNNSKKMSSKQKSSDLKSTAEDDELGKESIEIWEKKIYEITESIQWMVIIMSLVIAAIVVAAIQFITGVENVYFDIFGYIVFTIFVLEILIRAYTYKCVHLEVESFFKNVFNQIDIIVVALDIVVFAAGALVGGEAKFAKLLRILRLIRLVRVLRAVKMVNAIIQSSLQISRKWKLPTRYSHTPEIDTKTLVSMLEALRGLQSMLEDKYITCLLMEYKIYEFKEAKEKEIPTKIFQSVLDKVSELSISGEKGDDILIDLLMYSDGNVVQSSLDVLMTHHTSARTLLKNMDKIQLLVTSKRQKQYIRVEKCLSRLKHDADTHSIWWLLETPDHRQTSKETIGNLKELINLLRKRRKILKFDEEYEPDTVVQDMMRNLGCFNVSVTLFDILNNVDRNHPKYGNNSYEFRNSMDLVATCSEMFYWFIIDNQENQMMAYQHLDLFFDNIDPLNNTGLHRIISAIFSNNMNLMKLCPVRYISNSVEKILTEKCKSHMYLSLLSAVSPAVIEKQYEVIRQLTNPLHNYVDSILSFFVPVTSSSYDIKKKLMVKYLTVQDPVEDQLPADLAYHCALLKVFAGCTIGRANMNSVEAKVQSIFKYTDVCMAILDPNSPLIVKIRLLEFFYNAMVEVEMKIPNLSLSKCVWLFLESTIDTFNNVKDTLRQIEKNGWDHPTSERQKIEYAVWAARTIASFFYYYFDRSLFKIQNQIQGFDRISLRESQISDIVRNIFQRLKEVYEMQSPLLSHEQHKHFYDSLEIMNTKLSTPIVAEVKRLHAKVSTSEVEDRESRSISRSFMEFKSAILECDDIVSTVESEDNDLFVKIESIPFIGANVDSDIRMEVFIARLVSHVRESIQISLIDHKWRSYMDPGRTKTSIWIVTLFRSLIERKWGMTIHERDDEGGSEQDELFHEIMTCLNECGATTLCFDLIAEGIDKNLQSESINLLVALLFKEGGNFEVQNTIYQHLCTPKAEHFFNRARQIFQDMIFWHQFRDIIVLISDEEDVQLPTEIMLLRVMQLTCEGHYTPMQDQYRVQSSLPIHVNLLDDMVAYFVTLNGLPCRTSTTAMLELSSLILEVIQGPCIGNQDHFALNTELVEILNKQLRAEGGKDKIEAEELELKKSCVDIFQALLEGQGSRRDVYDRVLSVVHIDIIFSMSSSDFMDRLPEDANENLELVSIAAELRTESMVLLQMLCNYRPTIKEELGLSHAEAISDDSSASVEVMWRGELQRRFFSKPEICEYLAESSKDRFIQTVDVKLQENKLNGLLKSSRILYMEIQHQEFLTEMNLDAIFSLRNQEITSWVSFYVTLIINLIQLLFYTRAGHCSELDDEYGDDDAYYITKYCAENAHMEKVAKLAVFVLNIILIASSFSTVLLTFVVKSPVIYRNREEEKLREGSSPGQAVLQAVISLVFDGMTMYSCLYLGFALGGLFSPLLLPFLILDLCSKNPYAADIVTAVKKPSYALLITGIILCIFSYICAFIVFMYYNNEDGGFAVDRCVTLANCFKSFLFRGVPDANTYYNPTVGSRYLVDVFFFVQVFIVLNIVKGITIDTFVDLREKKLDRFRRTTEFCFICGIAKITFDRKIGRSEFQRHYKTDHNLWNYLYFIIYIWQQDKDDDDGLEQFIRRAIENGDISWIPIKKCLVLDTNEATSVVDFVQLSFKDELRKMELKVQKNIRTCEDYFKTITSRLHGIAKPLLKANREKDFDGESSIGSMTAESRPFLSTTLRIAIKEIKGIFFNDFSRLEDRIICRCMSTCGDFSVGAIEKYEDGTVFFNTDEEPICVFKGDLVDMMNTILRIQIIQTNNEVLNNFIGAVDLNLEEIAHASTTLLEKEFLQFATDRECTITIIIVP